MKERWDGLPRWARWAIGFFAILLVLTIVVPPPEEEDSNGTQDTSREALADSEAAGDRERARLEEAQEQRVAARRAQAQRQARRQRIQARRARRARAQARRARARSRRVAARRRAKRRAAQRRAAAATPNCDPNYSGACLQSGASDYDCEGGEGDGPLYTGPVTVVGTDIHDLDVDDSDPLACEPE